MASAKKNVWSKWYYRDWQSDTKLRMCSYAARGLWVEMICLMEQAEPRGHLIVNGTAPTAAQIAMLTGGSIDEVEGLISELEGMGVFSRNRNGVIYSRRICRDEKKRKTAQKNGKNGGNPTLKRGGLSTSNVTAFQASDNQSATKVVKCQLKTQKPEARSQRLDITDSTVSTTEPNTDKSKATVASRAADYLVFGKRLIELAGLPPTVSYEPLRLWLEAGISPDLILRVIEDRATTARVAAKQIHSFSYFEKPILEAQARAIGKPSGGTTLSENPEAFEDEPEFSDEL